VAAPRLHARRGFTLIEVLIIALIISILSSIAIINIQNFVDNNKRKAVVAETRQLAQALSFASDDIGYYPKLCFLTSSRFSPQLAIFNGDGSVNRFHRDFQVYGANFSVQFNVPLWKGPYMGVSPARTGAAQGVGGTVQMELANDPSFPPESNVQTWPADTYGEPYVVYAMKWEFDGPSSTYVKRFISSPITAYRESPNATLAVVSYGKNRLPGLGVDAEASDPRRDLRLYTESLNPDARYRIYGRGELIQAMADVYDADPDGSGPGVTQALSDDIAYEF
jgi:prepilin-type N-terminal cleavage/methylation domain-containing protein